MKVLRWIAGLLVTVIVVAFALANRGKVAVGFDPLPYALDLPLYVVVLGALVGGVLFGVVLQWLLGQRTRQLARNRRRRIAALEEEVAGLRRQLDRRPLEELPVSLPPADEVP